MDEELVRKATGMLKVLADPTRLKILLTLKDSEHTVSQLCEKLGFEQSAMSHQLGKLRAARLVSVRRDGRNSLYAPCDHHIYSLLNHVQEHVAEREEKEDAL
ncbi:MAG: metalloregulator ArsR/SmtB family transcription factor [Eubacteriales bacterium]|nr:metalloregulator ArsR/SmtB family transcription factor [Eubacteriales bacterium]MDD4105100.1 metalloregulator ArsR/SmtB family transcription factor [Eubacteriales bacterium]MDD4710367.1 metalloregulator ArsR/SmtB family transcription factor [Eubacteriales bacterium]